jgi:hypothetical protein
VAIVGGVAYLAKYGLPFTGGKGGNGAAEQVPVNGRGNSQSNGIIDRVGEQLSDRLDTQPQPRGGNTLGQVGDIDVPAIAPEGVDQDAYNQLSLGEKANFIDAYSNFSGAEKEAFNQFVEGVEVIQEAHPQATPEQIDTLVTNTLEFSAMKEEYVSAGDNWLQQAARAQWFDEQARRFFEATKDLDELAS